jgi:hypothetical protein
MRPAAAVQKQAMYPGKPVSLGPEVQFQINRFPDVGVREILQVPVMKGVFCAISRCAGPAMQMSSCQYNTAYRLLSSFR